MLALPTILFAVLPSIRQKSIEGLHTKYNCDKLVYHETFLLITDAVSREKQLKNWKREWKNKLINDFNPEWKDLSKEIGVDEAFIEAVKAEYNRHTEPNRHATLNRHAELVSASPSSKGIAGQARNDGTTYNDDTTCNDEQNELLNFEREHGKK